MSLIVLGLSHQHAPFELLEQVSADPAMARDIERAALAGEYVREALVLSTCNRTEIYADALAFHGAVTDLTSALTQATGLPLEALRPHLEIHFDERAVAHLFTVTAGLDSMAVGEAQIIGQVRSALARAQECGHVGPELNGVIQHALRVGKRVHAETDVDRVCSTLVDAGLGRAADLLGSLEARTALIVGAGGMGALAATITGRAGVARLLIANRTPQRAESLAGRLSAEPIGWSELPAALAQADLVITSTGAPGCVLSADMVRAALTSRRTRPELVLIDLAVPHDVEAAVADLSGVTLIGLAELGEVLAATPATPQVRDARDLVTSEVAAYLAERAASSVAPTVRALRAGADQIVSAELDRLDRRLPGLDATTRGEIERSIRRVVGKLLHTPTVRVKERAERGQGGSYARALSELFDLDPAQVALVSSPMELPSSSDVTAGVEL